MKAGFFTFVILRYVHDALAGEAVNVGLVAFWPDRNQLKFRLRGSMGRVRQLFPDADRKSFLAGIQSIKRRLSAASKSMSSVDMFATENDAEKIGRGVLPRDDSAFQWSDPGRGIAADRDVEFDRLYVRFIGRYDGEPRQNRPDEAIWKPVRDSLAVREIHIEFHEKHVSGETDQITFDHAWKNGSWHAYQAVSLDLATPEHILDKARRWRGQMVGVAEGMITDPIELSFLLGKPQDPSLLDAYQHALAIFGKMPLSPRIFTEDQIADLVDEIEDEFRSHENSLRLQSPPRQ